MLADPLTKSRRSGEDLLNCVRNGTLVVLGGMEVERSKKLNSSTWKRLIQAKTREGWSEEVMDWNQ